MALKDDFVNFLHGNSAISFLNFSFLTYKVYPSAYRRDVANAIDTGEIIIRTKGAAGPGAAASYDFNYDSLELSPSFSITNWSDRAYLIHECTHAHLDIQNLGRHSGHENEAVAYLAEAVFLEAEGNRPLGTQAIRVVAHRIARTIITGTYWLPEAQARSLVAEVARNPHYASTAVLRSNGFNRSFIHELLR